MSTAKKCTKCGVEQPIESFAIHKVKYRQSWCRKCMMAQTLKWKREHRDRNRELSRKSDRKRYWENPEAGRAKKLAQYHANKESWLARGRALPHEKRYAQWRIKELVRSGRMHKPDLCSECEGKGQRIEAHHPDYSKPEFVVWLCTKCHGATRRKETLCP